jgi:hypothetical protein
MTLSCMAKAQDLVPVSDVLTPNIQKDFYMLSPSSLLCNFVLPQVLQFSVVKLLEAICSTLVLREANINFCGILCRMNHMGHVHVVRLFKSTFQYIVAKYSSM